MSLYHRRGCVVLQLTHVLADDQLEVNHPAFLKTGCINIPRLRSVIKLPTAVEDKYTEICLCL